MMLPNGAPTIDTAAARAASLARRAAMLSALAPTARDLRAAWGWDAALLHLLDRVDAVTPQDVAAMFGVPEVNAAMALRRCGFARRTGNGEFCIEECVAARDVRTTLAEHARGAADRAKVKPFYSSAGRVHPLRYGKALTSLFSDGRARSTYEVSVVMGSDRFLTDAALRKSSVVELCRDGLWRAVPTVEQLRARIAELEAENAALREGRSRR